MLLLHPLKRSIGWLGQLNANQVAGVHLATCQHNPHHTGLADEIALVITSEDCCLQSPHGAAYLNQRASHTPKVPARRNPQPSLQSP